ncbi:MAG: 16S rRNA (cytosine(967)-C(5))-methyltransferase, partial [Spirulinaceae cyanobacterium RM2_2_10]|nr:16S rRNA (cytosine(967)-C(5))-methyltransferase [Spirulinaceae cyanobacterium RM2_2_10]
MADARQLALQALLDINQHGAYADIALERVLVGTVLGQSDRGLLTELVYGSVRRQRTLDALLDHLATKPAHQQPPKLRAILHLGLYQLRYLDHVPHSAAVHTSVELAKANRLGKLAGVVNSILRRYLREAEAGDPLPLPSEAIARLGVQHSFPDWIVQLWVEQFDPTTATQLCQWFNQPPSLDLRVNLLKTSRAAVQA